MSTAAAPNLVSLADFVAAPSERAAIRAPSDLGGMSEDLADSALSALLLAATEEELDGMRAAGSDPSAPKRMLPFTYSTGARARDGHVIDQSGWVLGPYRKNPVILADHDYSVASSVGRSVRTWHDTAKDALRGVVEFQPEGVNPFADMVYRLYAGKFLRTSSIGWLTHKWERDEHGEKEKYGTKYSLRFLKQEPLENSMVVVPSDPGALEGARSAGISLSPLTEWTERQLDGGATLTVPREALEVAHRIAGTAPVSVVQGEPLEAAPTEKSTREIELEAEVAALRAEAAKAPSVDDLERNIVHALQEADRAEALVMQFARDVQESHRARVSRMAELLILTRNDLEADGAPPEAPPTPVEGRDPFHGLDAEDAGTQPEPEGYDLRALFKSAVALKPREDAS